MKNCEYWLRDLLTEYPYLPIKYIRHLAKKEGWLKQDLRKARKILKIETRQEGDTWFWKLP